MLNLLLNPQYKILSPINLGITNIYLIVKLHNLMYSTAQRHCPLTRRSELARALIVNI